MSVFESRFEPAFARLVQQLGVSVTVTLADNSTLTRNAIFNVQAYAIDHTEDATFLFRDDSTTGGSVGLTVSQAKRCTKVTYNNTVWTDIDPKQDKDGSWALTCKAPQLIT